MKILEKILVGFIFVVGAVFLFLEKEYVCGTLLVALLLPLLKIETLHEFVFNIKDGFSAKFIVSKEKIEENIKENQIKITKENFSHFSKIESNILADLHKKYGGEIKTQIQILYGSPDKPQFMYLPDAIIQTETEIVFVEVKYILKPTFAQSIINKTLQYLQEVHTKLLPSIGNKKFSIKLILASEHNLEGVRYDQPEGINIELYRV